MTHPPEPDREAGTGHDAETDVSTGDPVDARFQIETRGEDDEEPEDSDVATGIGGSSFSVEAQMGETMPPELRPPGPVVAPVSGPEEFGEPSGDGYERDLELDPTDPGFTADDLASEPHPGSEDPESSEPAPSAGTLPAPEEIDWDRLADGDYVPSSTSEYQGLAEELERTRHEETEQMAVSASMPGMESAVVGLEDVTGEPVDEDMAREAARSTDLGVRLATGAGLMVLFLLSLLWSPALALLAIAVFGLAAGEFYAVLVRTGHHPIAAFGLLGVLGCLVGSWVWGVTAIPVAIAGTVIAIGLFSGLSSPRPHALRDAALTLLGAAWIGGMGAFALPIITDDDYVWLIAGVVLIVVGLDVGQYFIGRRFGRRLLAPVVSPKKTVEGLVGGAVVAVVVAVVVSLAPPYSLADAMLLAAVAIVLGPLGDLSVSSVKRRIGVKDMGTVLPGHGGILDRIDALLFVIPAAWVVYRVTGLVA